MPYDDHGTPQSYTCFAINAGPKTHLKLQVLGRLLAAPLGRQRVQQAERGEHHLRPDLAESRPGR
ncbi:MAG: hypothetical protein IRY91_06545 [Gemmatimonadaceae bacterium]|nr:hypothetical protein [Gemmatimonadaceae bacterium]